MIDSRKRLPEPLRQEQQPGSSAGAGLEGIERRTTAVDRRETAVGLREVAVDRREKNLTARTVAAEHATADLAFQAGHDCLTKLPNRSLFAERLEAALASAAEGGRKVGVMYMDLDKFKRINDTFGHEAGDQVLRGTAARLRALVRQTDTICRQGGDEFLVLLPDLKDLKEATQIAEKVVAGMGQPQVVHAQGQPQVVASHSLVVTISVGISVYPEQGGEAITLITNADQAMYRAKARGGNTSQVFSPDVRF